MARSFLSTNNLVMYGVILMYAAKVFAKVSIGNYVNSPVITGDGYHNFADILEALVVIIIMALASRPASGKYPFGRKNAESVFQLAVGIILAGMALQIAFKSFVGALAHFPKGSALLWSFAILPAHKPLLMGPEYFWWVFGTVGISALASIAASYVQIAVGKKTEHPSLVADGKETQSDGVIEGIALVGIIGEYSFNFPTLEYLFGFGVACIIFRTAKAIFLEGLRTLLQRSIGATHEGEICRIVKKTHGVLDVAELKTFRVGAMPICIMKVVTCGSVAADLDIKAALAKRIGEYMRKSNFESWDYYIRFETPKPERYRIAYPIVVREGTVVVASGMCTATHIRICDMEDGLVVRWKDEERDSLMKTILLLKEKKVRQFEAFSEAEEVVRMLRAGGIGYQEVPTPFAWSLGIS